jgi:hypothetical protein
LRIPDEHVVIGGNRRAGRRGDRSDEQHSTDQNELRHGANG